MKPSRATTRKQNQIESTPVKRTRKVEIDFKMYVRIIEKDFYYDNNWEIFWDDALKKGLVNYFKFNKIAPIFLMNIKDSHEFLVEKIKKDPYYVATKFKL